MSTKYNGLIRLDTKEIVMQSHETHVVETMSAEEYTAKHGRRKGAGNHAVAAAREMAAGTAIIIDHGPLACKKGSDGQISCSVIGTVSFENTKNKKRGIDRHYYMKHLENGNIGIVLYADGK